VNITVTFLGSRWVRSILFPEKHATERLQNYSINFKDVTDCK